MLQKFIILTKQEIFCYFNFINLYHTVQKYYLEKTVVRTTKKLKTYRKELSVSKLEKILKGLILLRILKEKSFFSNVYF